MALFPDAESFKRLADSADGRFRATLLRCALAPLGGLWGGVMAARNAAYDRGLLAVRRLPVPVVCVGNLTLGGTGKTPLVAWVARRLAESGRRPAIVSRGYAAAPGKSSDEAAELAIVLPGIPHRADRDRVAAALAAHAAGADAIVLDDGFQHRRLARDLDIVAIDATDPFGCGRVFPRGLLREPLAGLSRGGAAVLTRARSVSPRRRDEIRDRFAAICGPKMPAVWVEAHHAPVGLRDATGVPLPLDALVGRRAVAFAGIGNPAAFSRTLESLSADVAEFIPFPDHHSYDDADLAGLVRRARRLGAESLLTTLKDMVKVGPLQAAGGVSLEGLQILAVEIAMVIDSGATDLEGLLGRVASRGVAAGEDRHGGGAAE